MVFIELYSYLLIVIGICAVFLAYPLFNKQTEGAKTFGIMLLSMSIWCIAYGIELNQKELIDIKHWIKIEYIGIASIPSLWLIFTLFYSGKKEILNYVSLRILLITVPLVTVFLVAINDYHFLYFRDIKINSTFETKPLAIIEPGIGYTLFTIYFYITLLYGLWNLYQNYKKTANLFKIQAFTILSAALLPWAVNILYVLNIRPYNDLDLTPGAFGISSLLIGISLYKFKLFDVVPLVKENILESLTDGIIVINSDLDILYYNNSINDFFNVTIKTSFLSKKLNQIQPQLSSIIEKNLSVENFSISLGTIDLKGERNFIVTKSSIKNKNLSTDNFIIHIKEITSLIGIQKSLNAAEIKYSSLFNSMKDIFILLDKNGIIEEISPSFETETGFKRIDAIGTSLLNYIEGDKTQIKDSILKGKDFKEFDFILNNIWGKTLYVSFNGKNRFVEKELIGFEGTIRNITERNIYKKILEENQRKLTEAQNIAKLAYWEFNFTTKEMIWSESMYYQLGLEDTFNPSINSFEEIIDSTFKESFLNAITFDENQTIKHWFFSLNYKGETKYFRAVNRFSTQKEEKMLFGVIMDITSLKLAEDKLVEQNLYLKEIAQMQSHDVRRPLTSILGLIDLIEEQNLNSETRELVKYLKDASNQLDNIIHDIVKRTQL